MRRRTRTSPREVFLSHSSRDRASARKIAALLRSHGVPVWYSEKQLVGAQQWHDEIGHALHRCDWFVLLLSPHAVRSSWVKRELLFALRQRRYRDKIVPVRLANCDTERLSWTLDDFQAVDFCEDFDSGSRALLSVWGVGLKRG
jgi:hypothetical protein